MKNKVLFLFKIQSFSDVITNSSSELFVFNDQGDAQNVADFLDKIYPEWRDEYENPVVLKDASDEELETFVDFDVSRFYSSSQYGSTTEEARSHVKEYAKNKFGVQDASLIYPNIDTWDPFYDWRDDPKYSGKQYSNLDDNEREELYDKSYLNMDWEFIRKWYREHEANSVLLYSIHENPDFDKQELLENYAIRYHLG